VANYKKVIDNAYTIPDFYEDYVSKYPEGHIYYLTYLEYVTITTLYLKHLSDQIVHKSMTVNLPFRLGKLSVVKHKPVYTSIRKMVIDWVASRAAGKQIRLFNEHSNGNRYKFLWDRRVCCTANKTSYKFYPVRTMKREVARLIKAKENDYFERI
jgi:hypothetical protein